jgi:hypothetical protein
MSNQNLTGQNNTTHLMQDMQLTKKKQIKEISMVPGLI